MNYVIDASIALGFVLPDEDDDRSDGLLKTLALDVLCVPYLWHAEVLNGLLSAQRRKRIDGAGVDRGIGYFAMLDVRLDSEPPDLPAIRLLAEAHRLTAYDATYLELALRQHLPIATSDAALAKAARSHGVKTL